MTFDIGDGVDSAVNYILDHFAPFLDLIAAAIGTVTDSIQSVLTSTPMPLGVALFVLLSLWRVGPALPSSPAFRSGWSSIWACGRR